MSFFTCLENYVKIGYVAVDLTKLSSLTKGINITLI